MRGDMQPQFIGAASEVQVTHVAHVRCVEVQQFVTEQRLVATQLHLAHLRVMSRLKSIIGTVIRANTLE